MRREGLAIGLFFVIAGALVLLDALEVVEVRAAYLWPLLLIGFGIALIVGGRREREEEVVEAPPEGEESAADADEPPTPDAELRPPHDTT